MNKQITTYLELVKVNKVNRTKLLKFGNERVKRIQDVDFKKGYCIVEGKDRNNQAVQPMPMDIEAVIKSIQEGKIALSNPSVFANYTFKKQDKAIPKKSKCNVQVTEHDVFINNTRIGGIKSVYTDLVEETDKYMCIGIHDANPGCYKYLDKVLVIEKSTGKYGFVKVYQAIGDNHCDETSKLRRILPSDDTFVVTSNIGKAIVYPHALFDKPLTVGDIVTPKLNLSKPETYFDYEVCMDEDIIMTLKKQVPRTQLLKLPGFDMTYDTFKFSGPITEYGQSTLLFADSVTGKSWAINWGQSTSMVSQEVWKRRDFLMNCLRKAIPNHPRLIQDAVLQKA